MNKQRVLILALAALGLISCFLPWITIFGVGVAGTGPGGDGYIALFFFIFPIIMSLIGAKNKSLSGAVFYIAIITGLLSGLLGLYELYNINNKLGSLSVVSYGLYLVTLCGLAIPVVGFVMKDKSAA